MRVRALPQSATKGVRSDLCSLFMLTEYIEAALHQARYELMEDGRFFADIPPCEGLWADGDTLEATREQLRSVLED